jgi:hypothetical protein
VKEEIGLKIVSIEPTPSPNAMKLNMDENVPGGVMKTYTEDNKEKAPEYIQNLLSIEGVKSIFHTADFISIDRHPKGDWQQILAQAREAFGEGGLTSQSEAGLDDGFGEVNVYVQVFRNIPMQIRVKTAAEEVREALPDRFVQAAMESGLSSPNLIKERKLVDWGIRYGEMKEIAVEVLQEIEAAYNEERINSLVEQAAKAGEGEEVITVREPLSDEEVERRLEDKEWENRYAALEQMKPTEASIPVLEKALRDNKSLIRRLVVVYLGDIKGSKVLPLLFKALEDSSVSVRRTAGDTLSDIGDPAAIDPMIKSLKDKNKIVRWRAARFLYEAGDETAVEPLREAQDDTEFEVSMQVKIALERIEGGEKAEGSVWQQMTRARS